LVIASSMGNNPSGSKGAKLSNNDVQHLVSQTQWTKEEIRKLQKDFTEKDKDKSGELDKQEFRNLMRSRMKGATDAQLDALFAAFDSDNSKTVSFKELALALSVVAKGSIESRLELIFELYDANHDGTLDAKELAVVIHQMMNVAESLGRGKNESASFIKGVMTKLDENHDGQVSKQEWVMKGASTPSLRMLLGL